MFKEISHNPSQTVIGVNNGIYQLEFYYKDLKKNRNYNEIENLILAPNIENFIANQDNIIPRLKIKHLKASLLKKAKLTDILVFTPYFFGYQYVVSQKFVDCLLEENVSQNDYHLRKIEIKNVKTNYYLFFIPLVPNSDIDFPNSILYPEEDYLLEKRRYYSFTNYNEYRKYNNEHLFNRWKKISIKDEYKNKNIIRLQLNNKIFFSDKLIAKLVKKNITNMVINDEIVLSFSSSNTK